MNSAKITTAFLLLVFASALCFNTTPVAQAAINEEINYQGKLLDNTGSPVADTDYSMVFRLYTVPTGGSHIWTETQTVPVTSGLFSTMLGTSTSLSAVDFNQTLYLGVNIAGDGEMLPRKVLGAVPAAFEANNAQTLDDIATSSFLRSDQADEMTATESTTLLTLTQNGTGDILNLFDGGSEVFTVTDGGNVGIGTTTPNAKLTVAGNVNVDDPAAVNGGLTLNGVSLATGNTDRGNFYYAGAVGTTTPSAGGFDNVFIGSGAGSLALTNGFWNYGIGFNAMQNLTSANDNIGIGTEALNRTTTGDYNIALGEGAAFLNTEGSFNVALGYQALYSNTTGDNNAVLGYFSFTNNNGDDSVVIGNRVANNATSVSRGIFIGSNIDAASATADNQLNIGNIIFGTGVDGTGTTLSSGNIGIGTTSPTRTFSVAGDAIITGALYDSSNSAGTNGYILQTTGAGTQWVATSTLGLAGAGASSISFGTDNQIPFMNAGGTDYDYSANLTFDGTALTVVGTGQFENDLTLTDGAGDTPQLVFQDSVGSTSAIYMNGSTELVFETPDSMDFIATDPSATNKTYNMFRVSQASRPGDMFFRIWGDGTGNEYLELSHNGFDGRIQTGAGDLSLESFSKRVAINETAPDAIFEVSGDGLSDDLFFVSSNDDADGDIFSILNNGNVGIGTTSPSSKLTVWGDFTVGTSSVPAFNVDTASGRVAIGTSTDSTSAGFAIYNNTQALLPGVLEKVDGISHGTQVDEINFYERYLYGSGSGVTEVFDIFDPSNISALGNISGAISEVRGEYAYGVSGGDVAVFSLSDSELPVLVATTSAANIIRSMTFSGGYLFVVSTSSGSDDDLEIYNVVDPSNPVKVSGVALGSHAYTLAVRDNYVYVGVQGTADRVEVVDISDIQNPVRITTFQITAVDTNVREIIDDYLYVSIGATIYTVDISDPLSLTTVASSTHAGSVTSTEIAGDYLFVGTGGAEDLVTIYDISNPLVYKYISEFTPAADAYELAIRGGFLYVGSAVQLDDLEVFRLPALFSPAAEIGFLLANTIDSDTLRANSGSFKADLYIGQNAAVQGGLVVGGTASSTLFGSYSGPALTVLTGNVGIGTSSPSSKLTVAGDFYLTGALRDSSNNAGTAGYILQTTGAGTQWVATSTLGLAGAGASSISFGTDNQIPFMNAGGDDFEYSNDLNFVGTNLNVGSTIGYAIGENRVLYASSTSFSTLLGIGAGDSLLSDGLYNTALGYQALNTATSSDSNTAIGYQSLFSNTTGVNNTATGREALYSNISGFSNLASGLQSMNSNTTGSNNVASGYRSLYLNTAGGSNTATGREALYSNTIGDNNTGIGYHALFANTTGSDNTALGFRAGRYLTNGTSAASTTDNSVFIGAYTEALTANDQNSIVIGYQAEGLGSNTVVLGNDSIVTTALKGNVGIGTTSPSSKLTVWGDFTVGTSSVPAFNVDTASGRVAIGTSTLNTTNKFTVQGSQSILSENPVVIASAATTKETNGSDLEGDYWYVIADGVGEDLYIYDTSNPEALTLLGSVNLHEVTGDGSTVSDVDVVGNYAYIGTGSTTAGLMIVDVSDPYKPVLVGSAPTQDQVYSVYVQGSFAFVSQRRFASNDIIIFDISDPTAPTEISSINLPAGTTAVDEIAVVGSYLYLYEFNFSDSLRIIDISDIYNPLEVGSLDASAAGEPRAIDVSGSMLYLGYLNGSGNDVEVFSIASSTNPVQLGGIELGSNIYGLRVVGDYLYAAGEELFVINVASSTNLTQTGQAGIDGTGFDIHLKGQYVYVSSNSTGDELQVYRTNTLTTPTIEVGTLLAQDITVDTQNVAQLLSVSGSLNVAQSALFGGALTIQGTASTSLLAANTNPSFIVASGNVGIGTTSPSSKLTVAGDFYLTGALRDSSNNAGAAGYILQTTGTGTQWVATSSLGIAGSSFFTDGGDSTYLTALTDNLNIGTSTSNLARLNIESAEDTAFISLSDSTNEANANVYTGTTTPNGRVTAPRGSLFIDTFSAQMFQNTDGGTIWSPFTNGTTTHMVKITRDVAQSIPSVTAEKIAFDNIEFDTGGMADVTINDRINIKKDGRYLINAHVTIPGLDSTEGLLLQVQLNGATLFENLKRSVVTNADVLIAMSEVVELQAGDYIEMRAYHEEGGPQSTFTADTRKPRLSVIELAPSGGTGIDLFTDAGDNTYLTSTSDNLLIGTTTNSADSLLVIRQQNASDIVNVFDGATEVFSILDGGNVGIGTSSPYAKLSIDGDLALTGGIYDNSASLGTAGMVMQTTGAGVQWVATSTLGLAGAGASSVSFGTDNQIPFMNAGGDDYDYSSLFTFDGTTLTAPTSTFSGNLSLSGAAANIALGSNWLSGDGDDEGVFVTASGDVAIGTSTAIDLLTIDGGAQTGMTMGYTDNSAGYGEINTYDTTDDSYKWSFGSYADSYSVTALQNAFYIYQNTDTSDVAVDLTRFVISSAGNVGIGTTSPYAKLSINGDLALTGGIYDNTASLGTAGMVMQTTGSGVQWVATSSLGISSQSLTLGTDNQIPFMNAGGDDFEYSDSLTYDGTNLELGLLGGLSIDGTRQFYASGTTGTNIGIGATAADSLTTGTSNIGIGYRALTTAVSSFSNIAIGNSAMRFGANGNNQNIAIGNNALRDNLTGDDNVAIGINAGLNIENTSDNTILGTFALQSSTNTQSVVALGTSALNDAATADNTVAVGRSAGNGVAGAIINNSTIVGSLAGTSLDAASNNILLGYRAGDQLVNGNNNIVIGYDIDTPAVDSSNTLNVGNLLYGTGLDGQDSGLSSGNIGIGTTSPSSKLDVWGDAKIGASGGASQLVIATYSIGDDAILKLGTNYDDDTTGDWDIYSDSSDNGNLKFYNQDGTKADRLVLTQTGSVGIGTSTPVSKLALENLTLDGAGVSGIDQYLITTNSVDAAVQFGDRARIDASNTATTTLVGSAVNITDNTTLGNTIRGIEVQADRGSNTQGENTALSGFARTFGVRGFSSGDAGGSFEPAGGFFETGGTTQGNAIRGYSSSITTTELLSLFQEDSAFTGTGLLMNFGNDTGSFSSSSSKFVDLQNAGTSKFTVTAQGTTTIGDGTTNNMAGLQIGYGGLCVDNDGSCVASTTGRISSVSSYTGNSDLAEMYFSSQDLEPGQLVMTDGFISVTRATADRDATVLGVVSTKPGLLMGADDTSLISGQTGYPLALSGRVPVQLSNENGNIAVGDPLTLSSLPGIAMKATDADDIVGYALEAFDGTYAYTDGYVNQFGDDIAEPNYEALNTNQDATVNGCYFGGGEATGATSTEVCDPSVVIDTLAGDRATAEEIAQARYDAEQAALAALQREPAATYTVDGETVKVGSVTMFVDRGLYLSSAQTDLLTELTSTDPAIVLGAAADSGETLWSRLKELAQGFADGVLTITGIKTEVVESDRVETRELCVDDVCVTAEDLRALLEGSMPVPEETQTPAPDTTSTPTDNGDVPTEIVVPTATTTDLTSSSTPEVVITASSTEEVVQIVPAAATSTDTSATAEVPPVVAEDLLTNDEIDSVVEEELVLEESAPEAEAAPVEVIEPVTEPAPEPVATPQPVTPSEG